MNSHLINYGDQIIIRTHKVLKPFQVRKDRIIRVEKYRFRLDGIVGHLYGTTFEVKKNELVKVEDDTAESLAFDQIETERDNRNLKDDADNQKLKKEDLQALKKKGLTGSDIIEHLVENSATFKDKTEFSQAKYIKKKKKKWESRFTMLRPTTRLVAQMYFAKGPARICHLREDSLSQLLTYSNVRAHSKVMLCESIAGLLLGAVLERLGGYGNVVQFYTGSHPSREALEFFGFPADIRKTMKSFPLHYVSYLGTDKPIKVFNSSENKDSAAAATDATEQVSTEAAMAVEDCIAEEDSTQGEGENVSDGSDQEGREAAKDSEENPKKRKKKQISEEERIERREHKMADIRATREFIETRDMDALIVATKQQPTPIVLALMDFLAPSRPMVVHCMYKEPLLDCYVQLRNRGGVVNMQLSETWLRNYQVLPSRTHPSIQMSGTGGYLLTGITVAK